MTLHRYDTTCVSKNNRIEFLLTITQMSIFEYGATAIYRLGCDCSIKCSFYLCISS